MIEEMEEKEGMEEVNTPMPEAATPMPEAATPMPEAATPMPEAETTAEDASAPAEKEGKHRKLTGRVVGSEMDKTVRVLVERRVRHPLYGKYIRRSRGMLAHDEDNQCRIGDVVVIEECRRLSKRKSWKLAKILRQSETALKEKTA